MLPSRSLSVLLIAALFASSTSSSSYLRGNQPNADTASPAGFVSSKVVGHSGQVVIQGLRGNAGKGVEEQAHGVMREVVTTLNDIGMSVANIIHMDVALDDIASWPTVEKILREYWAETPCRGINLPAMSVLQLTNSSNCDDVVKVQLGGIVASRHSVFANTPEQLSMDFVSGATHISGVISPSSSNATTYAEEIVEIMPIIEDKLKEIGLDKHNIVKVSVAMEVSNPIEPAQYAEALREFNAVYNSWMDGAVLPTMVAYGVNAFPGSGKDGLQLQVSVVASREIEPVAGDAAHQVVAPLPPTDFILPYSGLMASQSHLWLSGVGYYGNSTDMQVAATEAIDAIRMTLDEAMKLDLSSIVAVDILVSEIISNGQVHELSTVYNSYFGAQGMSPPALTLMKVAEIGGESPLEITVSASRASAISHTGHETTTLYNSEPC